MPTAPLVTIAMPSIYKSAGKAVSLPARMAQATPDTKRALLTIREAVRKKGGDLVLSDLFRSYDMQLQAHLDFTSGKKSAFSPPPGGSMHEAARAFDLSLGDIGMKLSAFWEIAAMHGVVPIIGKPDTKLSEAWHFECRGSYALVLSHYADGKGTNMKPARAMASAAILELGIRVDQFADREAAARIQSGLIRLGTDPGNIDGAIGKRSRDALAELGITASEPEAQLAAVQAMIQERFPAEWFDRMPASDDTADMI